MKSYKNIKLFNLVKKYNTNVTIDIVTNKETALANKFNDYDISMSSSKPINNVFYIYATIKNKNSEDSSIKKDVVNAFESDGFIFLQASYIDKHEVVFMIKKAVVDGEKK